jgi:hypothetical protein
MKAAARRFFLGSFLHFYERDRVGCTAGDTGAVAVLTGLR